MAKENFIVSANYLDRNSDKKWLMRKEGQSPKEAKAVKNITATGVTFRQSSDFERGFGCSIVAACETATSSDQVDSKKPTGEEITQICFNGINFIEMKNLKVITHCDELILTADGSIWAQVKTKKPVEAL